jgi:hypothetical protein
MKGYIYKIVSSSTNYIYIGSTKNDINVRYYQHKCNYDNYIDNNSGYCTSYQIIKYNDSKIEIIREVETTTSLELKRLESEEIYKNCDICVNFIHNNKLKELKELKKDEYKQKLLLIKNKEIQAKIEIKQLKEQKEINKINLKLKKLEDKNKELEVKEKSKELKVKEKKTELEVKMKLKDEIIYGNNSIVTKFIAENYIITNNKKDRTKRKELFDEFNSTSTQKMTNKAFISLMRNNGFLELKSNGVFYFYGLKMKDNINN